MVFDAILKLIAICILCMICVEFIAQQKLSGPIYEVFFVGRFVHNTHELIVRAAASLWQSGLWVYKCFVGLFDRILSNMRSKRNATSLKRVSNFLLSLNGRCTTPATEVVTN